MHPIHMNQLNINDQIEIAYTDTGRGEPLVFIHGLASYGSVWQKNISRLKDSYRCIAIDLPGNGRSSKGDFPFSMFFYAESVVQFIQRLGLNEVNLCGHSMGGQIAQIIALRYPQLVKKLILAAPAGFEFFTAHDKLLFNQMMLLGNFIYADEYHLASTIRDGFSVIPDEAEGMINELNEQLFSGKLSYYRSMVTGSINGMMNEQVYDFLPQIHCPVLVIFGEKDKLIPNKLIHHTTTEKVARQGTAQLKQGTLHLIPNCGHFVQWEKADVFNRLATDFLLK
ncbi:MAG: alpha/beta hydrolase [Bacteroidia bacterium]|nr:alpha/beta hydrolase [Bacteroidia bacterium]